MSRVASLVATIRMQRCFNQLIYTYILFLFLFSCCILLEIKFTNAAVTATVSVSVATTAAANAATTTTTTTIAATTTTTTTNTTTNTVATATATATAITITIIYIICWIFWINHRCIVVLYCRTISVTFHDKSWNKYSAQRPCPFCLCAVNTLRPRQNGLHFADDIFKRIFLNENVRISVLISLKFVPKGQNNIPALFQIMAWRRPGDKPLSEPIMFRLPTHICVTRPQWVLKGSEQTPHG